MARIDFFALGGLEEDGKNLYCLEIDQAIYILDAGLKYPTDELYGVDAILPDLSYLVHNRSRIKGLFLSHGHEDHIGAAPRLLKETGVPVYGTYFTLALLKDTMRDQGLDPEAYTMHTVKSTDTLRFKNVEVVFYQSTHSIPESVGMAFNTEDGALVYAPDYTFDQNVDPAYATSFERLSYIARHKVLATLTETLGAEQSGHSHTTQDLDYELNQAFMHAKKRVVISCFSTDIFRIQKAVDIALKHGRRIAILGRKAQRMVDIALKLGVLRIPEEKLVKLKFIDEKNKNTFEDGLVIVTGDRHEPFYMLQRMARKLDRLIHLDPSDHVVLMTPPVPGTEKIAARTLDILSRNDINLVQIDPAKLPAAHASSEDIKLLTNILRPEHIIPVVGEPRHFFALRKIAGSLGYGDERVHLLTNGQVFRFEDGEAKGVVRSVKSGDMLVDGILEGDVSDVVLKDREILSQDGLLLLIAHINSREKQTIGDPEVLSRGFVFMKENEALIEKVRDIYRNIASKKLGKGRIDWRGFKEKLREDVGRYLYKSTSRRPIVIPILIDVPK